MMKKTALVTGATGGIGQAIARRLAADGFHVILGYCSRQAAATALAEEIGGETARFDLSSQDGIDAAAETARAYAIHVLVNNAGVSMTGLLQEQSEQLIRRVLSVDLESAIMMSRAVLPHMLCAREGRIINISSIWGVTGGACEAIYSAAKAGMIGFTRALAKEVGLSGITVNAVAPGVIDTEMNAHLSKEELAVLTDSTPMGRLGKPEDVAAAVAFLVRDEADFVTGQCLGVDGGFL